MVSHENLVIAGSFVLLVIAVIGLHALERVLGIAVSQHPLVAFLVVVGIAIVLPQLYLARTDDELSPRTRVRFAAAAIAAFALLFASDVLLSGLGPAPLEDAETVQNLAILAIGAVALLAMLGYEAVAGYRSSATGE